LIPPLIGFFSKQFVLYSALQNGYYFISLIAIIVSVISASYYLKIIKVLHTFHNPLNDEYNVLEANKAPSSTLFKEALGEKKILSNYLQQSVSRAKVESLYTNEPKVENNLDPIIYGQSKYTLTNTHSFLISSLTLIILLFFIKPSIILNSTQLLSLSLFYI